jgi:hypothetical protein
MWKISVPSRLHIFLRLLANNKALTRDNLEKRRKVEDKACLFCNETESVTHLFFDCCVAQSLCDSMAEITDSAKISDFESMGMLWLKGKHYNALNVCSTAVVWTIWKTRNDLCFQGSCWLGVEKLLGRWARLMRNWKLLNKPLRNWKNGRKNWKLVWKQEHQDLESSGLSKCERMVEVNKDQTVRSELLPVEANLNLQFK